jgi:hypothetical protein
VIAMLMREKQGINSVNPCPDHLVSEIGARIYDNAYTTYLNMNAASKSFVFRIVAKANLRFATYGRHSLRSSGTEKGYF